MTLFDEALSRAIDRNEDGDTLRREEEDRQEREWLNEHTKDELIALCIENRASIMEMELQLRVMRYRLAMREPKPEVAPSVVAAAPVSGEVA